MGSGLSDAGKPVEQQLSVFESESYRSLELLFLPCKMKESSIFYLTKRFMDGRQNMNT